jgi:Putative MetA-pathway of phenol degradation
MLDSGLRKSDVRRCGIAAEPARDNQFVGKDTSIVNSHLSNHAGLALIAAALALASSAALAGPPFMTDDPAPIDYKHSEFYVFSTYDKASDGKTAALPAFEYNYGILPDTQFHIVVPFIRNAAVDASAQHGIGDVELGVKYRLVQETDTTPQVGIFPMAELDTGDSDKGLGNGKTWWRLPVWIQKSWGEWTTYGGAGYAINHAAGQKNYPFGGWLLQKDIGERWTLGGEVFAQGKTSVDGKATTFLNFGGYYKFTPDFNLLFSAGHDIGGESHAVAYLGLWWTWGGNKEANENAGLAPAQPQWALSQRSQDSMNR